MYKRDKRSLKMIDIELEKQKTFTSQDYFDILNFAIDLAESNGFNPSP